MDNNFSSGSPGQSFGSGPTPPTFGSGGSGGNFIIGLIVLILAIGGAGYFLQSAYHLVSFGDIGNQLAKVADKASQSLPDSSHSDSTSTADANLTKKLNAYVDLLNLVSDNVLNSYSRYSEWVDLEKGPTGQERNVYGLYRLNDYSNYLETAQKVSTLQPQIDLDKDVAPYLAAYQKLKPLADQAYKYYDQGDYQDDNFAKGKAMHADLVAAFKDFEAINTKFDSDYEVVDIAQRQKEIAQYKEEGRTVAYNAASTLYLTQQMFIGIREELSKNGNDASKLDATTLQTQTTQLEALVTILQAEQSNKGDISKEYGMSGDMLFQSYVNQAVTTLKAAKALYRAVRDKNVPTRDVFADTTDGTPENFMSEYNSLVDEFNTLNRF